MTSRHLRLIASWASSRYFTTIITPSISALFPFNSLTLACTAPKHASTTIASPRYFSTMGMMPRRGFPQYTVFGPSCAISVRALLPTFKRAGNDGVSVERRGKLVLDFIPRNETGAGFLWQNKIMFSLSVEEVGLCLSQLPGSAVELSHALHYGVGMGKEDDGETTLTVTQVSGDLVDKVLTIEPGNGSTVTFKVDFMKNGVGGQTPSGSENILVSG